MTSTTIFLILLAAFVGSISAENDTSSGKYVRGCYYTNWSQYRMGIWKFLPENIEKGLCSHIFYAFVSMGEDFKLKPTESNDEDGNGTAGLYSQINNLKKNDPELKTLLSFGGDVFSKANGPLMRKLLENDQNRKVFIDSAIEYVRRHRFDGFDFNWFPEADTKVNFVKLVQEFHDAIIKEAKDSKNSQLLLTASVAHEIERIRDGLDGKALSEYLDFMNVMTFDYHGAWENETGFNAPMFDRDNDNMSLNSTMAYLVEQQIPKKKLVVGFASYGRGWTLAAESSPNTIPSPTVGPSPAQPITRAEGVAAYFEICTLIEKSNFVVHFDSIQRTPYVTKDRVWIGYDNQQSYDEGLNWLIENEFGGAFLWALDLDDFNGHCSSSHGKYPLASAIRSKLVK